MFRYVTLAIMALVIATPAFAATKQEVAAAGCKTLSQARKLSPGAERLKYRLIDDRQCWYSEAMLAKRATPLKLATDPKSDPDNKVAGKVPPSVIKRIMKKQTPQEPLSYQDLNPDNIVDDLDAVFEVMCGGPCPQLKSDKLKSNGGH
jgi:hypothetical protein